MTKDGTFLGVLIPGRMCVWACYLALWSASTLSVPDSTWSPRRSCTADPRSCRRVPDRQTGPVTTHSFWLTGDPAADALLAEDDLALLLGMVLDQQVPMEKAFRGPAVIAERLGGRLDAAAIAAMDPEAFAALCAEKPAVHRFPGAMAKRLQQTCAVLVAEHGGDAADLWRGAASGAEVKRALAALPGFGDQKAAIFTAVLAKLRGVRPPGWEEAAGPYAQPGFRSVADVVDPESLARVRETKRAAKAAARAAAEDAGEGPGVR